MARWPLLAVALLSLAGCTSPGPAAPDSGDEAGSMPDAPPAWEPWTRISYGNNVGVGVIPPGDGCHFFGVSTMDQGFWIEPGASLEIDLSWNLTAPSVVYLIVYPPDGQAVVLDGLPLSALERHIAFADPEAMPGSWDVSVCHQGPAAMDYKVTVAAAHVS